MEDFQNEKAPPLEKGWEPLDYSYELICSTASSLVAG